MEARSFGYPLGMLPPNFRICFENITSELQIHKLRTRILDDSPTFVLIHDSNLVANWSFTDDLKDIRLAASSRWVCSGVSDYFFYSLDPRILFPVSRRWTRESVNFQKQGRVGNCFKPLIVAIHCYMNRIRLPDYTSPRKLQTTFHPDDNIWLSERLLGMQLTYGTV